MIETSAGVASSSSAGALEGRCSSCPPYVAVATLTTSSILDPELTITGPWLKVFTAGYVLVGIGILLEVARRLGMGFMTARAEVEKAKAAGDRTAADGAGAGSPA